MLRYTVEDMTCGHCVQTITRAVTAVDPAALVAIDLATKAVDISSNAGEAAVASAIREAGYTPKLSTAAAPASGGCCGHCH